MAAYQANYGFNEGDPDANKATLSSSDPAPPEPNNKTPEKEKSVDPLPNPVSEQQETSAKEAKQKGEKRKPEAGKLTSTPKQISKNMQLGKCTFY